MKIWWDFEIQIDYLIPVKRLDSDKKKKRKKKKRRTCCIVDFTVSTDRRVKIKENKKSYKYVNLARELKML